MKRLLSAFLSLCMALTVMPVGIVASAEEAVPYSQQRTNVTPEGKTALEEGVSGYANWYSGVTNGVSDAAWLKSLAAEASPHAEWINCGMVPESVTYTYNFSTDQYTTDRWNKGVLAKAMSFNDYKPTTLQKTTYETSGGVTVLDDDGNPKVKSVSDTLSGTQNAETYYSGSTVYGYDSVGAFTYTRGTAGEKTYAEHLSKPYKYTQLVYTFADDTEISDILFGGQYNTAYLRPSNYELYAADSEVSLFDSDNLLYHFKNDYTGGIADSGSEDTFMQHYHFENLTAKYVGVRILDPMSAFNDASTAGYNSIRISALSIYGTVGESIVSEEAAKYVSVAQPETNIVGDVALVRDINSAAESEEMLSAENLPSNVIFTVDSSLNVLDSSGSAFSTVKDVITALDYKVLPVFRISDTATADALSSLYAELDFYDVMVMTDDKELLKYAREKDTVIRGALDLTSAYSEKLTDCDIVEITAAKSKYMATVVVLPSGIATKEAVSSLWSRFVRVWTASSDSATSAENYQLLLSGALGVISDDTATLCDIATNKLDKNTVTRTTLNVGHRGIPSIAPENTVAGAIEAWQNGADSVEVDLYLTSDGEVILTHDATTGKTCDQNLTVKNSTLAELKAINLIKNNNGVTFDTPYKLNTLGELLDAVNTETDMILALEIKDSSTMDRAVELVYEYGMQDRCYFLFNDIDTAGLQRFRANYPEFSAAYCAQDYYNLGVLPEGGEDKGMSELMSLVGKYNGIYNPKLDYYGRSSNRAAQLRGEILSVWTLTNQVQHDQYFLWGYAATTSDNCDLMKNHPKTLRVTNVNNGDRVDKNSTLKLGAEAELYGSTSNVDVAAEIISGMDIATASADGITFSGEGEVTFVAKTIFSLNATTVAVYSDPITVTVADSPLFSTEEYLEQILPEGVTALANPQKNTALQVSLYKYSRNSAEDEWTSSSFLASGSGGVAALGDETCGIGDTYELRTGTSACKDFLINSTTDDSGTTKYNWCLDGSLRFQYIVYDLGEAYDISTIAFVSSNNTAARITGAYELYASNTSGDFSDMVKLAEYRNVNNALTQVFSLNEGKECRYRYVALRILNPYGLSNSDETMASYSGLQARISEFQVYGTSVPESEKPKFQIEEYATETLPQGLTAIANPATNENLSVGYYKYFRDSEAAKWNKSNFSVMGTAAALNDELVNNSDEFRTGATACTDYLLSKETVDGVTKYNWCLDGSLRFQYILYDLGALYDIDAIALVSCGSSVRVTGAYEIYGSATSGEFEDMEKIGEHSNTGNNATQIFKTIEGRPCQYRYIALRILNPYSLTNSAETMASYTGLQARIAEFQVYGKKAETVKVSFADNAGNVVYTVGGYESVTVTSEQLAEAEAALPLIFGYQFVGWNDEVDTVTENKVIKAIYAKNAAEKYSVKATDGEDVYEGLHSFDARLTVTATGDGFSHWKDTLNGTAISGSGAYTFYVPGDVSLESVYNDSETAVRPIVLNSAVQKLQKTDGNYNLYFTGEIKLPEGAVLTALGITYTNTEESIGLLERTDADAENGIASIEYGGELREGPVMVILNGVKVDRQRFAKLYISYTKENESYTVFSDCTASCSTAEQ